MSEQSVKKMQGSHLSIEQVEHYRAFTLAPDELVAISEHLETCSDCRDRVSIREGLPMVAGELETKLLGALFDTYEHLTDAQVTAYVDDSQQAAERESVVGHLEMCEACRDQVDSVKVLRTLLETLPQETLAPLSAPEPPLRDTTGEITLETGGKVLLGNTLRLTGKLADRVRALITNGIVTPVKSLQTSLDMLRSSTFLTPAVALRGQGQIDLRYPVATAIRETHPTLRWESVPGAQEYTVVIAQVVSKTSRNVVWKQKLLGQTEITVPEEISLQAGGVYVWQVNASGSGQERRSPFAWFRCLSDQEVQEVEQSERDCAESALARIGLYEAYGLYEEALTQVEILAQENPGHTQVQEMRERIHAQRP